MIIKRIDPDIVIDALKQSLGHRLKPGDMEDPAVFLEQNLLDIVDSTDLARLIRDLEMSLDVVLPVDEVDLESIAHMDRLIAFICRHG